MSFAMIVFAALTFAQSSVSNTELYFVTWLRNGARICFPLGEHPCLTYSEGDIVISTEREELRYPHELVHKFTFSDEDISQKNETTGVFVGPKAQWQCQGDVMIFSYCKPGENVAIYDAVGHLLQQHTTALDGTLQIPLRSFTEGLYIVKTESLTYKFIKK